MNFSCAVEIVALPRWNVTVGDTTSVTRKLVVKPSTVETEQASISIRSERSSIHSYTYTKEAYLGPPCCKADRPAAIHPPDMRALRPHSSHQPTPQFHKRASAVYRPSPQRRRASPATASSSIASHPKVSSTPSSPCPRWCVSHPTHINHAPTPRLRQRRSDRQRRSCAVPTLLVPPRLLSCAHLRQRRPVPNATTTTLLLLRSAHFLSMQAPGPACTRGVATVLHADARCVGVAKRTDCRRLRTRPRGIAHVHLRGVEDTEAASARLGASESKPAEPVLAVIGLHVLLGRRGDVHCMRRVGSISLLAHHTSLCAVSGRSGRGASWWREKGLLPLAGSLIDRIRVLRLAGRLKGLRLGLLRGGL